MIRYEQKFFALNSYFFAVRLTAVLRTGCREQNLFIPEISAVAAWNPDMLCHDTS